jgi:2-polyprenyl-6-methoxyphenol hydroxylase-like FAD-dependent oxidoreductase
MVYTVTRTIIAGGGIVGLTAGRALLRAGMEVIVAEKADAIRAAGATLGLWANAVRVFDDLDVDVRSVGREAEMYFHGTSGQLLKAPEFGEEDHRYLLAHRASLNNLLAESVGYDNIRLKAAVAGFEEGQDRVTVRFTDGSTKDADLLIGADGLYSKVRAQLFPGTDAQEHAGHRAWRAIVKAEHIGVPDDRLIVGGKHRTRGGYVRAPDGTVFWLLSHFGAPAPAASVKEECLTRSAWLTDGTWDCKLTELIDATPEQDILRNQIMVVPPAQPVDVAAGRAHRRLRARRVATHHGGRLPRCRGRGGAARQARLGGRPHGRAGGVRGRPAPPVPAVRGALPGGGGHRDT